MPIRLTRAAAGSSRYAPMRLGTPRLSARIQNQLAPDSLTERFGASGRKLFTMTRQRQALYELPDYMFALSLALQNGLSLFAALSWLRERSSGQIAAEVERVLTACEQGAEFRAELEGVARRLPEPQLQELIGKLVTASERGTPIVDLVQLQAESVRAEAGQLLLAAAGRNETKMLIPTVFLILPITVLFAVFPSLQALRLGLN
jgi:tight adherence protein C